MGRSNPWEDIDQMWRVERHGGHNHVCNIWWLSVKVCGCSEIVPLTWGVALTTQVTLPCDGVTVHTTVWPCETVNLEFLNRALVLANAYKCAKFQLPSSISCGDMEGSKNKNWGLLISSDAPSAQIIVCRHSTCKMANSVPNFNFLDRLVSEIWGGPKIKSGSSWFPQTSPSGQIFIQGTSIRKCLQVCQISTP